MAEKKIQFSLVTPERRIFEGNVTSITIPGASGSLGILPGHVPVISQLGVGIIKVGTDEGPKYFGVQRGYMEFLYNKAIILTEHAIPTTFKERKETVKKLEEKHEIVQEVTEETKKIVKATASLKSL